MFNEKWINKKKSGNCRRNYYASIASDNDDDDDREENENESEIKEEEKKKTLSIVIIMDSGHGWCAVCIGSLHSSLFTIYTVIQK